MRRLLALLAVAVMVLAGCGDDGGGDGGAGTREGPTDEELAQVIAFRNFDFPEGWAELPAGAPGDPKSVDRLQTCLGPVDTATTVLDKVRIHGAGANNVAGVRVWVFPDAEAAQAAIEPAEDPAAFDPCVTEAVKSLLLTTLGGQTVFQDVTPAREAVQLTGATGAAIDFVVRVQSPSGPLATYPGAAFAQKGRVVVLITVLSNNNPDIRGVRRTLTSQVVNRIPAS